MGKELGVNIDHVATLRQARGGRNPEPAAAAIIAELAGADGITVHLREDRRHIQDRDLEALKKVVATRINLEMAAIREMADIAGVLRPFSVTLVPERREELTTEGGLDAASQVNSLSKITTKLQDAGILVSLFIDPDLSQVRASKETGAEAIEIHTGAYCEAFPGGGWKNELERIGEAAACAESLGLRVHAGHGLDIRNIGPILKIPQIREFNIGHSIIARAVFIGLAEAVREIADRIHGA